MGTSIHERITVIKTGSVNSYLIGTENGFVLIDSGTPKSFGKFHKVFEEKKVDFTDLLCIILTHTHYDHTGNAKEIGLRSQAPLIVHEEEAENAKAGLTPLPEGTTTLGKIMMKLAGAFKGKHAGYPPFTPDITVTDEYDLNKFGIHGRILSTPGHTKGSLSVLLEDEACFVGDSMFNFPGKSFYPPFANDEATLRTTWDYFTDIPCTVFYPGHGKPVPKEAFLQFVENSGG